MASRRLHLGIAQAILALLLFAGWTAYDVAAPHGPGVAITADRALSRDLAHAARALFPEAAIGSRAPLDAAADAAGIWAELDGDPDLDGMVPEWAMLDRPLDHERRVAPATMTVSSGHSAAYGATGPPPHSS